MTMAKKRPQSETSITNDSPTLRSALWAAWGDALGFPCELVDERFLNKRIPGGFDGKVHSWTRRVGGRMGAMIELPIGCISDDTQLRLATSRCIRRSGHFDAEAFSKIELSVFLSYQLGAGRGTKTAAKTLSRRDSRWYSNFFNVGDQRYIKGGGNGAAMRIQPHVWAAAQGKADIFMPSLLRDTVCTHGHLIGILGAALHGTALWTTLREREIPDPSRWLAMVSFLEVISVSILKDEMLASRWIPMWEQLNNATFDNSLLAELASLSKLVKIAIKHAKSPKSTTDKAYLLLVKELGGMNPSTRGAGTISAVLALWLAWVHRSNPSLAVETSASCLGSDTDTIATMVGALVGVIASSGPPQLPADSELIANDALRLEKLSRGETLDSFPHPDTLHWTPPKSLSDALGTINGKTIVVGLGPAVTQKEKFLGQGKNAGIWQWVRTEYGQTLLIKRREKLPTLAETNAPRQRPGLAPIASSEKGIKEDLPAIKNTALKEPRSIPKDPVKGLELLIKHELHIDLLHKLIVHYALLGPSQASKFAVLFSEHLHSLPKSDTLLKTLNFSINQTGYTVERNGQGELEFPTEETAQ